MAKLNFYRSLSQFSTKDNWFVPYGTYPRRHVNFNLLICRSTHKLRWMWAYCESQAPNWGEVQFRMTIMGICILWCNIFATYSLLSSYMLKLKLWCHFAIFSKSQKLNVDWKCQNCILKVKMGNRSFQHYLEFYICFHLELT